MTLPRFALLLVFPALAAGSPFTSAAIQTTCPVPPATAGYYSSTPVICDTGNMDAWLQFSGFTNSPSANNFIVQALANAGNEGFYYPENLTGPLSFQLGFEVQSFNEQATSVQFHVTESSSPKGNASVTMYVCAVPLASCAASPLMSSTINTADYPIVTLNFAATSSFGLLFVGNIDAASTLLQFETTVGTTPGGGGGGPLGGVPEPQTSLLVGAGLLLVGLFHSRMRTKTGRA